MTSDGSVAPPWICVVIVSYRSAGFIAECLESLVASGYSRLKILVVDNDSPDDSCDAVVNWAQGAAPFTPPDDWPFPAAPVSAKPRAFRQFEADDVERARFDDLAEINLIRSGANRGYAGGANVGLRALERHPEATLFWVLNPDCVVDPGAPAAFSAAALACGGRFSLMGGRASYFGEPEIIQADGGRYRRWLGRGGSVNKGLRADACSPPPADTLDYIHGMSMIASRAFLERAGLMDESWFLYFEEIDWAYRRGDLPLVVVPEARVRHRAGASSADDRNDGMPSPLACYIFSRNAVRFTLRWHPWRALPVYVASLYYTARSFLPKRAWSRLLAALAGMHGLPPPASVRVALAPEIWDGIRGGAILRPRDGRRQESQSWNAR